MYVRKQIEDLQQLRSDIDRAVRIWTEILEPHVEYAYLKGSAAKEIQTPIDYVPEVSDLDIHIHLRKGAFEEGRRGVRQALHIAAEYEDLFTRGQYWHLPRTQIIDISKMHELGTYYTPMRRNIRVLTGDPRFPETQEDIPLTIEEHRKIDRERGVENDQLLVSFRDSVLDRTTLDLWAGLRKINWRVSPSVNRLLSQTENPFEIWEMNRTSVLQLLEKKYPTIAELFRRYYEHAWELYNSNFESSAAYRSCLELGYGIMWEAREALQRLEA